jgi:hypothetical protein
MVNFDLPKVKNKLKVEDVILDIKRKIEKAEKKVNIKEQKKVELAAKLPKI